MSPSNILVNEYLFSTFSPLFTWRVVESGNAYTSSAGEAESSVAGFILR